MSICVEEGAPAFAVGLALKENWRRFALLLLVNAFVGMECAEDKRSYALLRQLLEYAYCLVRLVSTCCGSSVRHR
jgi:hypothetical protein